MGRVCGMTRFEITPVELVRADTQRKGASHQRVLESPESRPMACTGTSRARDVVEEKNINRTSKS